MFYIRDFQSYGTEFLYEKSQDCWLTFVVRRYIDRQYELQGYRIPLPDSEELSVPEPVCKQQ